MTGPVVVASVPSGHVYVRHLAPAHGSGAIRLPDPDPSCPERPAGARWWPPAMLDPAWAGRAEFDVFHLHFGFDACDPRGLSDLIGVLRARGKPLVFTVHDLRNPHHRDPRAHDEQLDVLVAGADQLITLTPGAAEQIERRWGRRATVVPHPHVVELATAARLRRARRRQRGRTFRVGLHVKSLRPSMDPLRILPALVDTVASLPGAVLAVNGHRDVLQSGGDRFDPELTEALAHWRSRGLLELRVHDYLDDAALWRYLSSLDVSVLPYRFGTHSGWLEACRDLGTTVVAPSCGFYREQGPVLEYVHDESDYDPSSLAAALRTAYHERTDLSADLGERRVQRGRIASAHESVYRRLVGGTRCASA